MTLRKLVGLATLGALLATPLHVAAQNGITSSPPNVSIMSISSSSEESAVTLGVAPVPPEQATADGLKSRPVILALLFYDRDGKLLSDLNYPPTLTIPRGGFRTALISAACGSGECILMVDTGQGPRDLPGVFKPLHDRVIVRHEVVCVEGPCGVGISGQVVVVDKNTGATRAVIRPFIHRRNDLII